MILNTRTWVPIGVAGRSLGNFRGRVVCAARKDWYVRSSGSLLIISNGFFSVYIFIEFSHLEAGGWDICFGLFPVIGNWGVVEVTLGEAFVSFFLNLLIPGFENRLHEDVDWLDFEDLGVNWGRVDLVVFLYWVANNAAVGFLVGWLSNGVVSDMGHTLLISHWF